MEASEAALYDGSVARFKKKGRPYQISRERERNTERDRLSECCYAVYCVLCVCISEAHFPE